MILASACTCCSIPEKSCMLLTAAGTVTMTLWSAWKRAQRAAHASVTTYRELETVCAARSICEGFSPMPSAPTGAISLLFSSNSDAFSAAFTESNAGPCTCGMARKACAASPLISLVPPRLDPSSNVRMDNALLICPRCCLATSYCSGAKESVLAPSASQASALTPSRAFSALLAPADTKHVAPVHRNCPLTSVSASETLSVTGASPAAAKAADAGATSPDAVNTCTLADPVSARQSSFPASASLENAGAMPLLSRATRSCTVAARTPERASTRDTSLANKPALHTDEVYLIAPSLSFLPAVVFPALASRSVMDMVTECSLPEAKAAAAYTASSTATAYLFSTTLTRSLVLTGLSATKVTAPPA